MRNYFQGKPIDFDRFDVDLSALTHFQQKVLIACRAVRFGQTATYSELARQAGSPRAVRAAASALAANPIPLVIPCHRILRKDGGFGGFSATGGIRFKAQLLRLERKDA
ncbi:MAG: methylated-DNA--[protein]-cysteine S-methyltransferase [Phycisphaerae bacterium]|nr:methylated-DNA--[protein]-cysteine S-methyltransferase [Phycisphaerae bacterium]